MRHVGTKDAAEVQNLVLSSQFCKPMRTGSDLKVTGTDTTQSCARHNPQVRVGDAGSC